MSRPVEIPEAVRKCIGRLYSQAGHFEEDVADLEREIAKAILLKAADVFDQCGWWKVADENRQQAAALGEEGE